MADGFSFRVDGAGLEKAFARLGETAEVRLKAACKVTALAIQRTAKARIAVATGLTREQIVVREALKGSGYVVTMSDVVSEQETARRKSLRMKTAGSSYHQEKHTGLWLEGGTIQGKPGSHTSAPRPFLYPAAELEMTAHERRVREALDDAKQDAGFGK